MKCGLPDDLRILDARSIIVNKVFRPMVGCVVESSIVASVFLTTHYLLALGTASRALQLKGMLDYSVGNGCCRNTIVCYRQLSSTSTGVEDTGHLLRQFLLV